MGFLAPTAHEATESTSRQKPGDWVSSDESTQLYANHSHMIDYGVTHRFSQPPSDFFLLLPSNHFQAGSTHGVMSFRGLVLL
jgi:hypothetical protein